VPPQGLQRHIGGRCGSQAVRHRVMTLSGEVPAGASDDDVLEHRGGQLDQMLAKLPQGVPLSAGVWTASREVAPEETAAAALAD
jgi:hypothetical protein